MKLFNRNFVLCLIVHFWYMLSFHMTTPQIAQFVVALGESTAIAGLVAGIFSLLALVFRPFSGFMADRFYRKHLMLLGYVFCTVSYFGYALSPNYGIVLAFRILHAFGLCIQTTLMAVVAMDFCPRERVVEGVGWVAIAATVGMGIGPGLGVALSAALGHRVAFAVSGALMFVTIGCMLPLPVERREPVLAKGFALSNFINVRTLPLMFTAMTFSFCSGITTAMLVLVGDVRGIAGVAVFFLISSTLMVLVRPFSGRLVDRKGLPVIMPFTFVFEVACMTLNAFAQSLAPIIVASVCRSVGQGVSNASLQGQALKESTPEDRGRTNSTFYMGIDIGQGLGAIIGGVLADAFGFTTMFMAGPIALVGGLISYLIWLRRHKAAQVDS